MMDACPFEEKTKSIFSLLTLQILVAIFIYAVEELGRLVGLPGLPLQISPIWPAAGIALSALLLFGWKVWPGLFIGFWAYNFPHLLSSGGNSNIFVSAFAGTSISLGSLLQALLGSYILRRYGTIAFFKKYRSTLIFLLPAGLAACLVASTIGVSTLGFLGVIPEGELAGTWLTFWIGDTLGVFLFTPLIIGYALSDPMEWTWKNTCEAVVLYGLLIAAALGIFIAEYPIANWLLPFLLWATFRFNIRGVASALLIITLVAVITTGLGHGPFVEKTKSSSLFFLVTFIEIIAATMLVLVSVLNERRGVLKLLQEYNTNLEKTITIRTQQLQEAKEEIEIKEKLTSLSVLATGISYEIKSPLVYIKDLAATASNCIESIKKSFEEHKYEISPTFSNDLSNNCSTLLECLSKIIDYEKQANQVVDSFLQRSRSVSKKESDFKKVNIHHILNTCCYNAKKEFDKTSLRINIVTEYDAAVEEIQAIPFDLLRAFSNIIDNSLYAMKQKSEWHAEEYQPTLSIKTSSHDAKVEIVIRDNGTGMSEAILRRMFQPFFSTKTLEEGTGLGLAIAHDIIVQEHHGSIKASSQKGAYTEITITLPSTL